MDKSFAKIYKITDREFWHEYWFYYKKHTIIGVIAVILLIFTLHSCMTQVKPDFTLLFIGETALLPETPTEPRLEQIIEDVNQDGKKSVLIYNLPLGQEKDYTTKQTSVQKADVELGAGDPFIFVTDSVLLDRYVEMEAFEDTGALIEEANIPEARIVRNQEGAAVAVDVTDTEFSRFIGITSKNKVYCGIKVRPEGKQNDKTYNMYHNEALRMYGLILNNALE